MEAATLGSRSGSGALPLLLIAVCPLSMMFMMRGMQDHKNGASAQRTVDGDGKSPAREERLADLKSQLGQTRSQQEAIAREISKLEATSDDERRSFRYRAGWP